VTVERHLTYRGDVTAAVGVGGALAFVTAHPEGHATAVYRLDAEALGLDAAALPKGGSALAADGGTLWVAGTDPRVYQAPAGGGAPKPLGPALDAPATALAPLADGRLAALVGSKVVVLARKDGAVLQALDLPEPGTCLAADPTGRWLAAGTARGTVAVFDAEDKPEYLLSASERLHEGAVTALLFEPDDLRLLSAGADQKLLSTHARGKLEPEDKGRGNAHTDAVTSLSWGPGDRLYSGGRDGAIKSWPRAGAVKPATVKDGVGRVVALALVEVHGRPRLAAACDDNTLRFFPVDAAGKIGELSHRVGDAYARAGHELSQQDNPARREAALKDVAGYADARSMDLLAGAVDADGDPALRLAAAGWLGAAAHPRAATLLEKLLAHRDEAVRVAAFTGLRGHLGGSSLKPIDLALAAEKADVGRLAVEELQGLAAHDDQALARLADALEAKTPEVRLAAVVALEAVHEPGTAASNLAALGSKHSDVRRAALVRLFRRDLLGDPAVGPALHRRLEDADPEVRRAAFLLTLYTRPRLLQALRARDPELQRQLLELEGGPAEGASGGPAQGAGAGAGKAKDQGKKKQPAQAGPGGEGPGLDDADVEPLLQATASRALDTSLRGARGLAWLGDPRAFGLLLQLSREENAAARAEVCLTMGALDDPRAVERLRSMLHDPQAEVRDAAFTALTRIHQSDPLLAAESGLNAPHEDVRRRGLQALTAEVRKDPSGGPALELLARALNDSAPAVRSEAFKAALGLRAAGGGSAALRFAMRSVHADVRREVLTEATAQVGEPWGWDLVLGFLNDPDPALRSEAFDFGAKRTKGLELLDAGLGSRYADLRKRSVDALVKKATPAAQALLVRALDDEDRDVRLAALASLVDADALAALGPALGSAHADVRVQAATALARHGDPRAFAPLRDLATAPEPPEPERRAEWLQLTASALEGLGVLGDPAALPHVIPLLDSPEAVARKAAARALVWVTPPGATDALRQALPHADPEVKYRAALGLAYAGDASVSSLVFSEAAGKVLTVAEQVAAALALGDAGEGQLVAYLDDAREATRARAFLLLMMREWKAPRGDAARCLACLSSRSPRLRLDAARALEALPDPAALAGFVAALVNDRGGKPAWTVPAAVVDDLAGLLVHGAPHPRARTALLLDLLNRDDQAAFDQAGAVHAARFAAERAALGGRAGPRPLAPPGGFGALRELAFGAYVGLVREQGGSAGKKKDAGTDPQVVRVRQSALGRLLALAKADPRHAAAAIPVFVQAMGDPNQVVRVQALENAQACGLGAAALASEAIGTGFTDLGVRGLELLTGGASEADGQAVLERTMLARKDDLAVESARLLAARRGEAAVAERALEAAYEPLRAQAVAWLGADYDKGDAARQALRRAAGSRHRGVREAAAYELAGKKDPAAFDALAAILGAATLPHPQKRAARALLALGDPRTPGVLIDRVEKDPGGTAATDELLRAAGEARRPEAADRLLGLWDSHPKPRESIFRAVLTVSGHDQPIEDPEDERPDARWLEEQHPRNDAVLARLIQRVSAPADVRYLSRLFEPARWARGEEVGPALAALVNHPDEGARRAAVRALGWRLRKRGGDPEPLRKALAHRDPVTQFLAAEGLARAGRADGLNVLLASVDLAGDLDVRRGAVAALGELADERALDALLKLATDDGHALQEPAAEAIGHLGRSPRAPEVFALLARLARGDSGVAFCALHGLRWFDSPAGWAIVRGRAADASDRFQAVAVGLLGHNDDPATRDLLLRLLADGVSRDLVVEAMTAARRLWGPGALEPAYAALRNEDAASLDDFDELLALVRDRGEPRRVFEILPACADDVREALATGLLGRAELPVAEARSALGSPDPRTAGVAARVLGRAGPGAADAGPALAEALARWLGVWREKRRAYDDATPGMGEGPEVQACLRRLVWAAGRLGEAVAAVAADPSDDPEFQPVRLEAVLALAAAAATPAAVAALEAAARDGAPGVRAAAAQALGRLDPSRAAALAGALLSDGPSFRRLPRDSEVVAEVERRAAGQVHYQGVALPGLIERGELATLAAVAEDRAAPKATRLGAIEGLAALAIEPAEAVLLRIGTRADDEDVTRWAALRGVPRSRRARRRATAPPTHTRAGSNADAGGTA
jgi:ParB family chromosome partitioning protein